MGGEKDRPLEGQVGFPSAYLRASIDYSKFFFFFHNASVLFFICMLTHSPTFSPGPCTVQKKGKTEGIVRSVWESMHGLVVLSVCLDIWGTERNQQIDSMHSIAFLWKK
mmetsp:Transcript_30914/g.60863  ORF Transcript_30914/g.60863 Transcript_30914/m.60863 type:complete len:109 (-) Transcript_30914:825-1151(-)